MFGPRSSLDPLRAGCAALGIVASCALLLGCQEAGAEREDALARARRRGVIRVGYANERPYAYMDSGARRLTGEAPEIARRVLGRLGVERVEGVLTEFGALIPGLKAGRFDVIAAGMYVTPPRAEQIHFSNPTYAIGEAFVVAAGNPRDLHSYEDVARSPSARLGVMAGAIEYSYAQQLGVPDERIVVFPTPLDALAGVEAGRVEAFAGTALTVTDLLRARAARSEAGVEDRVELAEPFEQPTIDGQLVTGYGAFGFRLEDERLKRAFDLQLSEFLGSPEHLALIEPFGFGRATLPRGKTTAELLGRPSPPPLDPSQAAALRGEPAAAAPARPEEAPPAGSQLPAPLNLLPPLLAGLARTLAITLGAGVLAAVLALAAGLARLSTWAPLRGASMVYVEVFRGTSALVQLFWFFYVLPLVGVRLGPLECGILVLGLHVGAYGAEVVRGAVKGVAQGQWEAAQALDLTRAQTLRFVVLPQALVAMVPPAGNLAIELLKGTALVSLITIADLTFAAQTLRAETGQTAQIYLVVLLLYLVCAQVIACGFRRLEAHLARAQGRVA